RTSPPPPEAETVRPLMSCEPPQWSHVLLGMDNYSPGRVIHDLPCRPKTGKFCDGTRVRRLLGRWAFGVLDDKPRYRTEPVRNAVLATTLRNKVLKAHFAR